MEIRPSIELCAVEMERKLRKNDHKSGWENLDIWYLYDRAKEELEELQVALAIYQAESTLENIKAVIGECADVCNFSHMIMTKVCKTTREFERGRPKERRN